MKKATMKVLTLLMALVLTFSLAACGGSSDSTDLTGTTWALSGGSQGSTKVDKATLESLLGGEMVYSFAEDGKVTLSLSGAEVEGTWSQDGNEVSLDIQGDTGTMTIDGDKMILEQDGIKVEFTKK